MNNAVRFRRRIPHVERLRKSIEHALIELLEDIEHVDHIAGRCKDEAGFLKKAKEKSYENPFEDMEDQIGVRIYTLFRSVIDNVRERVNDELSRAEEGWRTEEDPRAFGYETHHIILQVPSYCIPSDWPSDLEHVPTFELQIRTVAMHAWAEGQHSLYKAKAKLTPEQEKRLAAISALYWSADNEYDRLKIDIERNSS